MTTNSEREQLNRDHAYGLSADPEATASIHHPSIYRRSLSGRVGSEGLHRHRRNQLVASGRGHFVSPLKSLRSGYTMRTKFGISDAFVQDCVFVYSENCSADREYTYWATLGQYLRKNAISDVRDCALCTHSVFKS